MPLDIFDEDELYDSSHDSESCDFRNNLKCCREVNEILKHLQEIDYRLQRLENVVLRIAK